MEQVLPVCAGADAVRMQALGRPYVHLCRGLRADGTLCRIAPPGSLSGGLLGLRDCGLRRVPPSDTASALAEEAAAQHAAGVLADLERPSPAVRTFLSALATETHARGLALLVPLACAGDVTGALPLIDGVLTGGDYADWLRALRHAHPQGFALSLRAVSLDFPLTGTDRQGRPLSAPAREALRVRENTSACFSEELCAQYFTYAGADGPHFVLYDDPDTLSRRIQLAHTCGVEFVLLSYADAAGWLIPGSDRPSTPPPG